MKTMLIAAARRADGLVAFVGVALCAAGAAHVWSAGVAMLTCGALLLLDAWIGALFGVMRTRRAVR